MIHFKMVEKNEENFKRQLFQKHRLEEYLSYETVIALEEEVVLGMVFFEISNRICRIEKICMIEEQPLVKDGLIRTLINAMDIHGIKMIIAKIEGHDSFFCSLGFYPLFISENMIDLELEASQYKMLYTDEFFNSKCCKGK